MSSFLQNQLKNQIAAGFKNKLLKGRLERKVNNGVNEFGDPIYGIETLHSDLTPHSDDALFLQYSDNFQSFNVEGFTSKYSDFYRAKFGIPDTDLKVILIAGNCDVKPEKEDNISFSDKKYQIRSVNVDPAEATYVCQAYEVQ